MEHGSEYDFLELYFPDLNEMSFSTEDEQWQAWERFTDMLCMISLVIKEEEKPESLERIGCLLNDTELMKTLEPREKTVFPYRKKVRKVFEHLLYRGRMEANKSAQLPLWKFLNTGILESVEIAAFIFAACVDRNRKYERIFGVLQEEKTAVAKPTIGLIHDLCALFLEEEENSLGILMDEDSFLNRFFLEESKEPRYMSRVSRPVSLQKQVLSAVMGNPIAFGKLSFCGQILETEKAGNFISHEAQFEKLVKIFTAMTALGEDGIIRLEGVAGVGKKFLMASLGKALGMDVLCIHIPKLLTQNLENIQEILKEAVLKTVCENTLLYLEEINFRPENMERLQWIITFLQDYVTKIFVGTEKKWPDSLAFRGICSLIPVSIPTTGEQKKFWSYFAEEYLIEFAEDVDLDQMVSMYDMTPEKIRKTLVCASLTADVGEKGFLVDKALLVEEIRHQCSTALGEYAKRMESPFVWADLQVSEQSAKQLQLACDRIRYRSIVNDGFGFGAKFPYGNGVSIVLYGPPGTGKTMAAQVLARELGLDIYRIDLSQIGSKYIGETEKNLGRVFDAARFSNAVLFFDEADALFTKRTDVSNSNDKYANAETAYLLQKIEEYSGVSILATNVMQNFDNAFKRRMTFMIPIERPDEATRLQLWQKVFPKEAPLEADIDFTVYAKVAELTGSNIKSAALAAAYRGAAQHRKITNQDLIEAVDFEYRRTGRMGIGDQLYAEMYMK